MVVFFLFSCSPTSEVEEHVPICTDFHMLIRSITMGQLTFWFASKDSWNESCIACAF